MLAPKSLGTQLVPASRSIQSADPQWRPHRQLNRDTLPQDIRYWLLDEGSLTSQLIALNSGAFSVRRLKQAWETPRASERRLLGIKPRQTALIREVELCLDDRAVVFARSVFPLSSLNGSLRYLRQLQNNSLGAILFKNPLLRRGSFEVCLLDGHSDYLPSALQQQSAAWSRRSRFEIDKHCLLVSEVFLEGFKPWPDSSRPSEN